MSCSPVMDGVIPGTVPGALKLAYIPGPQVNHPGELAYTIEQALTEDRWAEERHRVTGLLYPHRGQAAARAADAIVAHVG
jgi:hypothetical protein